MGLGKIIAALGCLQLLFVQAVPAATLPQRKTSPAAADLPVGRAPGRTCREFTRSLSVSEAGIVTMRSHQRCRALTAEGLAAAKVHIYEGLEVLAAYQLDDTGKQVDAVLLRHKMPNGKTAVGFSFHTLALNQQYVIDVEEQSDVATMSRGIILSLESTAPTDSFSIEVEAPENFLQVAGADIGEPNYRRSDGRETWSWHATGLMQVTPYSEVSMFDIRPRVAVSFDRDFTATMRDVAHRYEQAESASQKIPDIARTLMKPGDSPRERASAALDWMRQNIAYTSAREFVDTTLLPTPVDETLSRGKGMCRDLVAVYGSLLRALGVRSEPVFLNTIVYWQPKIPLSQHWNHIIVYLPELDLFVDPSDKEWPLGMLNFQLAYHLGFNVDQLKWMDIPYDSRWQGETDVADIFINANDRGRGTAQLRFRGALAGGERSTIAEDVAANAPDRRAGQLLKRVGISGSGTLKPVDTGGLQQYGYDIAFDFDDSRYLAGTSPLPAVPSWRDFRLKLLLDDRYTQTICVPAGLDQQYTVHWPAGTKILAIPQDMHFSNDAGDYSSDYRRNGADLLVKRSLQMHWSRPICTPADVDLMTELESFAARDRAQTVSLSSTDKRLTAH